MNRSLYISIIFYLIAIVLYPAQDLRIFAMGRTSLKLYSLCLMISMLVMLFFISKSGLKSSFKSVVSRIKKTGMTVLFVYLLFQWISLLWSIDAAQGLGYLLKSILLMQPVFLFLLLPSTSWKDVLKLMLLAIILSNILSFALNFTQLITNNGLNLLFKVLSNPEFQSSSSYVFKEYISLLGSSFSGGKNVIGTWAVWCITFGLYFWGQPRIPRVLVSMNVIIGILLITITFSRSALISLTSVICILMFLQIKNNFREVNFVNRFREKPMLAMGGVLFISTLIVLSAFRILPIVKEGVSEGGVGGRLELISIGIRSFMTSPLGGTGIGSTKALISSQVTNVDAFVSDNYHNGYIEVLATYGMIGVFLLFVGILSVLRAYLKKISPSPRFKDFLVIAPFMGYMIQALFMYNFNNFEFYLSMSVIIGFIILKYDEAKNDYMSS